MDFSRTIYSLVGVLVAVIMIATVAMPAITSASTTTTTTTTTEIQDVEVSDPVYYTDSYSRAVRVTGTENGTVQILQYNDNTWSGYTYSGTISIPIIISNTIVSILYYENSTYYVKSNGISPSGSLTTDRHPISIDYMLEIRLESGTGIRLLNTPVAGGGSSFSNYAIPDWCYIVSIPQYGGNYVTSTSQEVVTLKSLDEIVAGSVDTYQYSLNYAVFHDGVQTHNGDYTLTFDSVQTDSGVDVSLKASYNNSDVLVIVPTTTEVTVTQTITVQTEYGPILNVVLLMLLIVPVTAVAAMLYTRRD